ncbi:MAG TPA: WcaI family glycosyltransferase [Nevskiaceae bacterium]|nr:WcaI family glycosyltransferase [Nevskiaceae bacterium]
MDAASAPPLKLLIYGLNYAPEQVGVGKFTSEMAEWLAEQGHAVEVVTAPAHYPQWALDPADRGWRWRREQRAGVSVFRCPLWVPARLSTLKRILCCLSFVASSFFPLLRRLRQRPDVLLVIEPSFFCVPPALLLGWLFGIPVWLHVQDFELGAARGLGMVGGGALSRLAEHLEGLMMRRLDRVTTLTRRMDAQLEAFGVPESRRGLLPNWVDCRRIHPLPHPSPLRAELGYRPDQLVLLYAGSFGRKHGLELLVELAARLRDDPRLQLLLVGEGVEREALVEAAAGLPNVRFLPLQSIDRLNDLLNLADIHLLPQKAAVADAVLPSKLTGMFASGRPVVATAEADTELARLVAHAGVRVPPGDAAAFERAIRRLADQPQERERLGRAGRQHAELSFDRGRILRDLEAALQRCRAPLTAAARP